MDNTSIIVLAAGSSDRFKGVPKYGLEFNGKPLIHRTGEMFPGALLYDKPSCPNSVCTCDTFQMTRNRWDERTIILLGDVYYTEVACHTILNCEDTNPVFFTDRRDIFALLFHRKSWLTLTMAAMKAILSNRNNGRLWELYRKLLNLGDSDALPHKDHLCHLIDDITQDFDEPEEYTDFLNGKYKNKIHG